MLLDFIFPHRCFQCHTYNSPFCSTCAETVWHPVAEQLPSGMVVTGIGLYSNPILARAIQLYKYNGLRACSASFSPLLTRLLGMLESFDYSVPVPLHQRRLRQRGFNQTTVLANQLPLPMLVALQRPHYTHRQATLQRTERFNNMQGAFTMNRTITPLIIQKRFLLIDDVCSTGATLEACAEQLYQAGAQHVAAIVLALNVQH